ncbi:hypothetical protein NDU88_003193 [Pleurodeles waltl]|uniref:Uncharacterized protein n=1 Tax=Pleurodeles waltl TaxID=8319 RepID=A0AAV7RFV4_PLEWA|nr:hypothetical protein NDU88_003193 [Pleurodeles waltl]
MGFTAHKRGAGQHPKTSQLPTLRDHCIEDEERQEDSPPPFLPVGLCRLHWSALGGTSAPPQPSSVVFALSAPGPAIHYRKECKPPAKARRGKQGEASLGPRAEPELDEDLEELLNKARELLAKQRRDATNKRDASPVEDMAGCCSQSSTPYKAAAIQTYKGVHGKTVAHTPLHLGCAMQ